MNGNNFNSMMNMTDNTMFATENSMAEITNNLEEYKERLRSLKEVQDLTSEIEVQNPNSIVQFGQKASENISKISDELLNSMKEIKAEETTEMLVNLTKIMDKFDVKEIKNIKQESFVSKIFKSAGNTIARLFQKYDTMGYEVEKVYVLLKKYESDIKESNNKYDLRIAENVAIQAAPMLQSMQMSNFNLMRKINSSFIVTLPIFKQCLAQAVLLKRQEIQAKSLKQLDDKTNELIMRNAANTSRQSVEIAKMASSSSVAIETLEKSYETIMRGIEETKAIQQSNALARKENTTKLESIKMTMKKSISL